jgi:predicted Zn-dependent protease
MYKKLLFHFIIILGSFLLIWFGISYLKFWPKKIDVSFSSKNEMLLGDRLIGLVLESETIIADKEVDHAVCAITDRLVSCLDSSEFKFKFHLIEKDDVNAFAFPGGHVVIFSGLIEFCESPEELAAVLAHELGHVEQRHVVNQMIKQLGVSFLISLVFNGNAEMITEVVRAIITNVFSREQEAAADFYALQLLEKSKINPNHFGVFMSRMEKKLNSGNYQVEFFSTHPNNEKRANKAFEYRVKNNFIEKKFDLDWLLIKQKISENHN